MLDLALFNMAVDSKILSIDRFDFQFNLIALEKISCSSIVGIADLVL